jgi:hypothetical protein
MDGWYPKVRIGKRRERVPVLVTLGVRGGGEKVVLDMRIAGEESAAVWGDVVADLVKRKLGAPVLAVIDGNPGLPEALRQQWPKVAIQRCTVHKLRNLEAKAPASLREELREDYRRMIFGKKAAEVEKARAAFTRKWKLRCPAVVKSLEEARRRAVHFPALPEVAVASAADDERVGADQRGVPAANEDASEPAGRGCGAPSALRPLAKREDQDAKDRRVAGDAEAGDEARGRVGEISAGGVNTLLHHLTDTASVGSSTETSRERSSATSSIFLSSRDACRAGA